MKYYVYSPQKEKPTYIHNSYEKAFKEAKRLAEKEMCLFQILCIATTVEPYVEFEITNNLCDSEV